MKIALSYIRTSGFCTDFQELCARDCGTTHTANNRPLSLILHSAGNDIGYVIHGRKTKAAFFSRENYGPSFREVDKQFLGLEILARRALGSEHIYEKTWLKKGVFENLWGYYKRHCLM